MTTEHHINIHLPKGVMKVMSFNGQAIPRVGDCMKLTAPSVDGLFEVTRVQWMITNSGKFVSEAQSEIWVKPYEKPPPAWFMALGNLVFMMLLLAAIFGGLWYLLPLELP